MLAAIATTTLHDDVYGEDATTTGLERDMARRCGHEAAAFVPTGTMANQLALRALLDGCPPHGILADARAHILRWEAGGIAHLSGAMVQAVRPRNGRHLTVADVEAHAILADDVHRCPTRAVSIENTAGGAVVPLADLRALKRWAARHGVGVHVDGARLWEAVAAGAGSLRDFGACADALTLDFSKNLGAPMGAVVVGSAALVGRVRRIRKGIGGGLRQAGVLAAAARQAVEENFGSGLVDERGVLRRSQALARVVGCMWTERGGRLLADVETNIVWLDLRRAGVENSTWNAAGMKHGIRLDGKRVVLHHQINDEALTRLAAVMDDIFGRQGPLDEGQVEGETGRSQAVIRSML